MMLNGMKTITTWKSAVVYFDDQEIDPAVQVPFDVWGYPPESGDVTGDFIFLELVELIERFKTPAETCMRPDPTVFPTCSNGDRLIRAHNDRIKKLIKERIDWRVDLVRQKLFPNGEPADLPDRPISIKSSTPVHDGKKFVLPEEGNHLISIYFR